MLNFIEKISNTLPVVGGATGAITQATEVTSTHLPSHDMVIQVIIVSTIGAVVGYLIKLALDFIVKKIRRK